MPLLADRRFVLAARVAFFGAGLFALVMALLPQPPYIPGTDFSDKLDHIMAFSVLAALAALAFPKTPRLSMIEHLSFFGALIEVAQAIPALGRDCDILDWAADTLAVLVVTGLASLILRRRAAAG